MKRNPVMMEENPNQSQSQFKNDLQDLPVPKLEIPWQWVLLGVLVGAFLMNMRPVVIRQ
jgi:hypothetical protein